MSNQALVKHGNVPVQLVLDEFQNHQWYAQSNYVQALEHAQGTFYAHELGLQKQAEMHMESLGNILTYDRALMAVDMGGDMGFDCKLFGVIDEIDSNVVRIESSRFNWCVFPLSQSDVAVPPEHLKRILEFEKKRMRFNGYGVAVPEKVEYEPVIQGLKRAARHTWKLFKIEAAVGVGLALVPVALALGILAAALVETEQRASHQATSSAMVTQRPAEVGQEARAEGLLTMLLKDPVLLGAFCSRLPGSKIFLVEIGRWEYGSIGFHLWRSSRQGWNWMKNSSR